MLVLGCRGTQFRDPSCEPSGVPPNPIATLADIGLFTEDGAPIEIPNAVVTCTQGSIVNIDRAQYHPEDGLGAVLVNGALRIVLGEGTLFNHYTCGIGTILRRCGEPLRVRVDAPGCETYVGTMTWDENYDLNGPNQTNFRLPVLLRCAGDAGADPTMRDIPALNRDAGNLSRDVPRPRDAGTPLDVDTAPDASVTLDAAVSLDGDL